MAKMPACNVLPLGQQKKALSGFSQAAALPHTGFIYFSQIVQDTPPELRYKAAKLVSTKVTLAARVDSCHESPDGLVGRRLREGIEKKLDKLQEPPPVKFVKPLPKPIEQSRKKRGGKRVRKMKERYAMTEFRKNANRLNFADVSLVFSPSNITIERPSLCPVKIKEQNKGIIINNFCHKLGNRNLIE